MLRVSLCATGLGLALVACGPHEAVEAWCDEECDCVDCSTKDYEACLADKQSAIDFYAAFDCEEEYVAYLECRTAKSRCAKYDWGSSFALPDLQNQCDSKDDKRKRCYERGSKVDTDDGIVKIDPKAPSS